MRNLYPELCKNFTCIGDKCPDTCCAGWKISIDDATDRYYLSVDGEFGERLKNSINRDQKPSHFIMDQDMRCPFLRSDNLCSIYRELGEDKLSETCTQFPRGHLKINDLKFSYISFACPEMVRLTFQSEEPLIIELTETEENAPLTDLDSTKKSLTDFYLQSFITGVSILQDRSFSIRERLALCILFYEQQQSLLDKGNLSYEYSDLFSRADVCRQLISEGSLPGENAMLRLRLFSLVCKVIREKQGEAFLIQLYDSFLSYYNLHDTATVTDEISNCFRSLSLHNTEAEHLLVYLSLRYTAVCATSQDIASSMIFIVVFYTTYLCFIALYSIIHQTEPDFQERIRILSRVSRFYEHNSASFSAILELMKKDDLYLPEKLLQLI